MDPVNPEFTITVLEARIKLLSSELEQMTKHANEGWALANTRTAQWKSTELQNGRYQKALEEIAHSIPKYPDGDAMSEEMCAKIALGLNCPQCGCAPLPCPMHKDQPIEKPKQEAPRLAADWQCRSLNNDKLCCQKENGHPGDHRYWDDKIDAQWTEQAALKRKDVCPECLRETGKGGFGRPCPIHG